MNTKKVIYILIICCFFSYKKLYSQEKYNFSPHSDFVVFWSDFKKAVNDNDKDAVLQMTAIPFVDQYKDVLDKQNSLTSNTPAQFIKNYDKIITQEVILIINKDEYTGWSKEAAEKEAQDLDGIEGFQVIGEGEFIVCASKDCNYPNLIFSLSDGVYKLSRIPYYE